MKTTSVILVPKESCKICLGRGYVLTIDPTYAADKFRVARPCECVKAVVEILPEEKRKRNHTMKMK